MGLSVIYRGAWCRGVVFDHAGRYRVYLHRFGVMSCDVHFAKFRGTERMPQPFFKGVKSVQAR